MDRHRHGAKLRPGEHHHGVLGGGFAARGDEFGLAREREPDLGEFRLGRGSGHERAGHAHRNRIRRAFERIEVHAKDFNGVYNVAPQSVYIRVSGPKSAIEKLKLTSDEVYLNLRGLPAGEHQVPLELSLPLDVKVVEQKPQRFRVRIIKPAE